MTQTPSDPKLNDELTVAAYNQNVETFRSLNQLMWQIPLIAMTLTGGLWFGVSSAKGLHSFQLALLLMATAGNIGLIVILHRLRYIMEQYLTWLSQALPSGFVSAKGKGLQQPFVVRVTFQILLGLAVVTSIALALVVWRDRQSEMSKSNRIAAVAYYDRLAEDLASTSA